MQAGGHSGLSTVKGEWVSQGWSRAVTARAGRDEAGGQGDLDGGAEDVARDAAEPPHGMASDHDGRSRRGEDHGEAGQCGRPPTRPREGTGEPGVDDGGHGTDGRRPARRGGPGPRFLPRLDRAPPGARAGMPSRAHTAQASRLATRATTASAVPAHGAEQGGETGGVEQEDEDDGRGTGRTGVAPPHHLERPGGVVAGGEAVGEVGETVEVQGAGEQRRDDERQHGDHAPHGAHPVVDSGAERDATTSAAGAAVTGARSMARPRTARSTRPGGATGSAVNVPTASRQASRIEGPRPRLPGHDGSVAEVDDATRDDEVHPRGHTRRRGR